MNGGMTRHENGDADGRSRDSRVDVGSVNGASRSSIEVEGSRDGEGRVVRAGPQCWASLLGLKPWAVWMITGQPSMNEVCP